MKKVLLMLGAAFILMACNQPNKTSGMSATGSVNKSGLPHAKNDRIFPADTTKGAKISFKITAFNMGEVKKGQKVTIKYPFTNTGRLPLKVARAIGSCGCTTPCFSKKAVAPGGSDTIKVVFDSSDYRPGMVDQQVTVFSNAAPGDASLFLKGEVKKP